MQGSHRGFGPAPMQVEDARQARAMIHYAPCMHAHAAVSMDLGPPPVQVEDGRQMPAMVHYAPCMHACTCSNFHGFIFAPCRWRTRGRCTPWCGSSWRRPGTRRCRSALGQGWVAFFIRHFSFSIFHLAFFTWHLPDTKSSRSSGCWPDLGARQVRLLCCSGGWDRKKRAHGLPAVCVC